MSKAINIALKELSIYFKSAIAYIILILTISVFNGFFYILIQYNREATLRDIFQIMEFMFVFIVPLLTMKLLAEEKSNGTIEFLMTTPTSRSSVIFGKFLGCFLFFCGIILLTGIYFVIILYFGRPDILATISGYAGIILEGAFFIAIGLLTSSLTRSQIVAAISSYMIIFIVYFSSAIVQYVPDHYVPYIKYLSPSTHLMNFATGLVHLSDIVYFISGIIFCLLLTGVSFSKRL